MGLFGHHHGAPVSSETTKRVRSMIERGEDPKEMMIEVCRPSCTWYQDRLARCEVTLANLEHANPEKTCMYPLRDWVTCIDNCVNPTIQAQLVGQERGFIS